MQAVNVAEILFLGEGQNVQSARATYDLRFHPCV
jgi:hypothetical protein